MTITDLEPGIEIALSWLEQTEQRLKRGEPIESIADNVLHFLNAEMLFALEILGQATRIWFTTTSFSPETLRSACEPKGVFSWLARIRFAYFFNAASSDLSQWPSQLDPPIANLLAVPIFRKGRPGGCLAVANRRDEKSFEQGDAMLLSLAGAILLLGLECRELQEKLFEMRQSQTPGIPTTVP